MGMSMGRGQEAGSWPVLKEVTRDFLGYTLARVEAEAQVRACIAFIALQSWFTSACGWHDIHYRI